MTTEAEPETHSPPVKWWPSIAIYGVFLAFTAIADLINASWPRELLPPMWVSLLWAIPLVLFAHVRATLNRLICYGWILWALVGSVNIIASYLFYGDFYLLDVGYADFVYIVFTTVFLIGIIAFERFPRAPPPVELQPESGLHPWVLAFFMVFPFLWFASVYLKLGYVPVLLKISIVDDLYELDYGPLYGFAVVLALSMLAAIDASRLTRSRFYAWLFRALVLLFGGFSFMTSKRETFVVFVTACFAYMVRFYGTRFLRGATLVIIAVAFTAFYIGGQLIRDGLEDDAFSTTELQLSFVGVEYRDYVYTVNYFEPEQIPNYDWASSAAVAMVNSSVLDAVGVDKEAVAAQDSAEAWKEMLGAKFGIRTGIVSELYFAFGFLGLVVVFGFGAVTAWIGSTVILARTKLGLLFATIVYAFSVLSIANQTPELTGTLPTLLYVWTALWLLRAVGGRAQRQESS